MTDLPGELMGALTQGLSQFGVSLPPIPSLTGATSPSSLGTPGLGSPDLASPGLTSPGLTSPGLTSPGLTSPGLTSPGLTTPGLTPGATPGLTTPGLTPGATPGLTPGLTSGATPGLSTPGLTSPGLTPGLTSPSAFDPATGTGGLSSPSELPISDPVGLDPGAGGTYPILGDPIARRSAGAQRRTGQRHDERSQPAGRRPGHRPAQGHDPAAAAERGTRCGRPGSSATRTGADPLIAPAASDFPPKRHRRSGTPGLTRAAQTLRCRAAPRSLCSLK